MKAIVSTRPGGPETLDWVDLPSPLPGPGEVVVDVRAVTLNFFDMLIIADKYQVKPPRPFSPGGELAGVVSAIGPGVSGFAIGDRVAAAPGHGAARQRIAIDAGSLVKIPDGVSFEVAAALIITYGTALLALELAHTKPGDRVAVLGAAGGVGSAAIEIGRLLGAHMIACASSPEKLAFCHALGASDLVDYSDGDLKDRLRGLTGGHGVDVVLDMVGGPHAEPAVRALAWEGRYMVIGFAAGAIPKIPLNLLLLKQAQLHGVNWGGWASRSAAAYHAHMARLFAWATKSELKVPIEATYPLEDTARAISVLAGRGVKGKIVLVP